MRHFDGSERRARMALRHRLSPTAHADGPVEAARGVIGLHGTDPASVYLSTWARTGGGDVAQVQHALYEERSLLRVLCMRRTAFVVPVDTVPVVEAACSRDVAARERKRLVGIVTEAGLTTDVESWLAELELVLLAALAELDEPTAAELAATDERLTTTLVLAPGKKYEAKQTITSRLLGVLAAEGKVARARPLGSWTSLQARWSLMGHWAPHLPDPWPAEEAAVELARLWLARFGPAAIEDLKWWTGWTMGRTRKVLAQVPTVEVDLDGVPGLVLEDDDGPTGPVDPWVALLPALDPTTMGWRHREWYLGTYGPQLFDVNGNAGPTVWVDGRVVGGWAQRVDGEVVFRCLEDVGASYTAMIEAAAVDLRARIGDARLAPRARGRAPLEKDLMG